MGLTENYHFIIGLPRSGTALLSHEINKLKNTIVLPESKHVLKMIKSNPDFFDKISAYYSKFNTRLIDKPYSVSEDIHHVIQQSNSRSILENAIAFGKCFTYFNQAKELHTIIDKNPMYTFHWKKITPFFPDSKFIIMVRNPKAFVHSKISKKNPKEKFHNPYYIANTWNNYVDQIIEIKKKHKTKVMLLKYEEYVSSPSETLQKVISFLNISTKIDETHPFQKNYSDLAKKDNLNNRLKTKFTDLSKPINENRIFAYKEMQSRLHQKRIEAICFKNMKYLGYEIESKKIEPFIFGIPFKILGKIHNARAKK